ncbi:DNA helicase/exodeoxyribonuclease V, subunit B [Acetitomaculum ruminis DSM 5522]|uniref:DNA helicase/exodeoxyribonuclease V, subunit B n=1 Tax=Acetitomaculum ruminis DSM 5522 TaxID=1120918 RepID=A0A1I0ZRG6_9FIRM|nr:PD-(D/E)XK nuclease family protein [Acetitomaculum ruminis]SFB28091.1 DNA helicase/exodeoxyribonuclease V, subunit B [Acetitomaculum ruminis DSM 5522]
MALQLVLGNAGSGKSKYVFDYITKQSIEDKKAAFLVIVPEQFTMSTQRNIVKVHPGLGMMNIDVLSFQRLAFRIFEETGSLKKTILEDTGKNLVLKRVMGQEKENLNVLGANVNKIGYITNLRSIISEFTQYNVDTDDLFKLVQKEKPASVLSLKLKDIHTIYKGFEEFLENDFVTAEQVLDLLCQVIKKSKKLKNTTIVLDGFTGFTPIQERVLEELLKVCKELIVTVTIDHKEDLTKAPKEQELFNLSKNTIRTLKNIAASAGSPVKEDIILDKQYRFKADGELEFLEKNLFRYNQNIYKKIGDEISFHSCNNPDMEVEYVADTIDKLVRNENIRFKDIGIVCGDMEIYGNYFEKTFNNFEIPFFMDYKRDILQNPFIECIRAALEIADRDFSFQSVFRFLKCGMDVLSKDDCDILENYCVTAGIKGYKKWKKDFVYIPKGYEKVQVDYINYLRKKLLVLLEDLYIVLRDKENNVGEKTRALYDFITKLEMQKRLKEYEIYFAKNNEPSLEKEYSQIYKTVIDMFDKYVTLLGDEKMSLNEYSCILDAGFEECKIGIIPQGLDMVQVGDIERTRFDDIKVLFILGVNEGVIPSNSQSGGIISSMEREYLESRVKLAYGARKKAYIERFYIYLNMTKPSEKLYICFSKNDNQGKTLRPSFIIKNLKYMFPEKEVFDEGAKEGILGIYNEKTALDYLAKTISKSIKEGDFKDEWKDLYGLLKDNVKDKLLLRKIEEAAFFTNDDKELGFALSRLLYGDSLENSVTRLEDFSKCAFSHFLDYGLRLNDRENYEFDNLYLGSIMHKSLEIYSSSLKEKGYDWIDIPEDISKEISHKSVDLAIESLNKEVLYETSRNEYNINRIRRLMERTVWAIKMQLNTQKFKPDEFEFPFKIKKNIELDEFKDKFELYLKGRIDRIDLKIEDDRVYFNIYDYKTGKKDFSLKEFYYGISLQLLVYMNAVKSVKEKYFKDKKLIIAGLYYYHIDDPVMDGDKIKLEDVNDAIVKELSPKGIVNIDISGNEGKNNDKDKLSSKQIRQLSEYLDININKFAKRIMKGDISKKPFNDNKVNGCTYCNYSAICGFDAREDSYSYNYLKNIKEDRIWQLIEKELESGLD